MVRERVRGVTSYRPRPHVPTSPSPHVPMSPRPRGGTGHGSGSGPGSPRCTGGPEDGGWRTGLLGAAVPALSRSRVAAAPPGRTPPVVPPRPVVPSHRPAQPLLAPAGGDSAGDSCGDSAPAPGRPGHQGEPQDGSPGCRTRPPPCAPLRPQHPACPREKERGGRAGGQWGLTPTELFCVVPGAPYLRKSAELHQRVCYNNCASHTVRDFFFFSAAQRFSF